MVVEPEQLEAEAWAAAERVAKVPPYAAQVMKRSIHQVYDKMGFTESLDHHLVIRMLENTATDIPEKEQLRHVRDEGGLRAFLEARDKPFA